MRRLFWVAAVLMLGLAAAPNASAITFTFNVDYCTNPCLGGVPASNNGGTVTLTQPLANVVDVVVTLNSLVFHDQGLESFAFNISGNPSLTQVASLTGSGQLTIINGGGGTWTLSQPAGNTDGAGNTFGYSLNCTAGAGACAGSPSTLEFQIELTGLTLADLETRSGAVVKQGQNFVQTTTNVDFAANVANGACTGIIGAGNGTGESTPQTTGTGTTVCRAVPEPGTLMLIGTGLLCLGAGAFGRRKWIARRRIVA